LARNSAGSAEPWCGCKYELMFWSATGVVVTEIISLSDGDDIGKESDFNKCACSAAAGAQATSGV
jgi:hypothetical protein